MSMPDVEKGPWVFHLNQSYSNDDDTDDVEQHAFILLKEAIVYFSEWSVVASSNGTDYANIGDEGELDYWDDYTDIDGGSSWIVLENSVTGEQLLIDSDSSDTQYGRLHYSSTGDFGANGTASSPPTATEYVELLDDKIFNSPVSSIIVHSMISSDGTSTRLLWEERSGVSFGGQILLMEELTDVPDEWTSSYKRCVNYLPIPDVGLYPAVRSPLFGDFAGSSNKWDVYWEDADPTAEHITSFATTPVVFLKDIEGSGIEEVYVHEIPRYLEEGGYVCSPISIINNYHNKGIGLGRIADLFWAPENLPSWSTIDSSGSREWFKFGCFVVPWDGSTKPLSAP